MLPFAFERNLLEQPRQALADREDLLSKLLLLQIENERLRAHNDCLSKEVYRQQTFSTASEKQLRVELQLKKLQADNLTLSVQQLQQKCSVYQSKIKQQEQAFGLYQRNSQSQANSLKSQLQNYKVKFEEELAQKGKYHQQQVELERLKKQFADKQKQKLTAIEQLNKDLLFSASLKEKSLQEMEKSNKELKKQNSNLREDLIRKEQQVLSFKEALKDAPKMEELNRWIAKVKEYEEKQQQACARISQMSQDLCSTKEKYRRLQYEYKELQKVKNQLEEAVTTNKDNEDSMTLYFDRLEAYQKAIKDLQAQIQRLQSKLKDSQWSNARRLKKVQEEKQQAIKQWHVIEEEMNKQRSLVHAMQAQLDQQSKVSQSNTVNSIQSHARLNTVQSRLTEKQEKKSVGFFGEDFPRYQSNDITLRENSINNSNIEQRIVFHSDRVSHSTERLQTQQSDIFKKESNCQDCKSMARGVRCNSSDRMSNPFSYGYRNQGAMEETSLRERQSRAVINDEKRMLMDKLNYLRPQTETLRLNQKPLSSLYNKNYRQMNSSTSVLKQNMKDFSKNRLTITKTKGREQKQNVSEMIAQRYSHLIGRS